MKKNTQIISVTTSAIEAIKSLIKIRGKSSTLGIRVSIESGGCSGFKYKFEYVDKERGNEDIIETNGVKIFIDSKATLYLIGTELDHIDEKVRSGFVFVNPNEKGKCGCGKSFYL